MEEKAKPLRLPAVMRCSKKSPAASGARKKLNLNPYTESLRMTKAVPAGPSSQFSLPHPLASLRPSGELNLHTYQQYQAGLVKTPIPQAPDGSSAHGGAESQPYSVSKMPGQRKWQDAELVDTPLPLPLP